MSVEYQPKDPEKNPFADPIDSPELFIKKYKSAEGVYYWVEPVQCCNIPCFCVVAQKPGFPKLDAFDEWLCKESAADEIAKDLSEGKDSSWGSN